MNGSSFNLIHMQEAMDLLGVSRSTLDRWRVKKRLPFIKIGKEVLFDREALLSWMSSHSQTIGPSAPAAALPAPFAPAFSGIASVPGGSTRLAAAHEVSDDGDPVTITIGYQSGTAHMWSSLIIRELGLLEEELRSVRPYGRRYRVQWLNASSGLELVEGMIAGRVHIASLGDYPIMISQQLSRLLPHFQAVLLAFDGKAPGGLGISVVVPEGGRIRGLSGLEASAVSTVPNSSAGYRLRKLLTAANLPSAAPIEAKGMNECLTGILERKVGASAMWEPYISLLMYLGAGEPLAFEQSGDDYLTGVVADGSWVRTNEDAAVAYLKAHIRAHRFIRSEPFAAAQLIHRATGFPAEVAGSVITRVRWDAAPYGRDLETMRRLGANNDSPYGTSSQITVEPAYLSQAARALQLPCFSASSISGDWAKDAL